MGEVWEQSRRMALAIAVGPFVEVSRERLQGVRQRIERVWNERVVPLAERYESQRQARRQVRDTICSFGLLSYEIHICIISLGGDHALWVTVGGRGR